MNIDLTEDELTTVLAGLAARRQFVATNLNDQTQEYSYWDNEWVKVSRLYERLLNA